MEGETSILGDPHHNRADAKMVAMLLRMGCVSEEKARKCLAGAFDLAEDAIEKKKQREYAAAMSVPLAAARMEMDREKFELEKSVMDEISGLKKDLAASHAVQSRIGEVAETGASADGAGSQQPDSGEVPGGTGEVDAGSRDGTGPVAGTTLANEDGQDVTVLFPPSGEIDSGSSHGP